MSHPNTHPDATTSEALPEPDLEPARKAVTASALGNTTEWFDYGLYAVSITHITQHFSPAAMSAPGTADLRRVLHRPASPRNRLGADG